VMAPLWPQIHRSEWALPASVLAGPILEDADLASVGSVGVGSASLSVGGHDR
jgi:hypothetical protein